MIVGRRGLFGLLAAPAIISITGRLQPALIMPPSLVFGTANSDINPLVMRPYGRMPMSPDVFRAIVEPVLRKHFEEAFKRDVAHWRECYERREVQRRLCGLPASDDRSDDWQAVA